MIFVRQDTFTETNGTVVHYRSGNLDISATKSGVSVVGLGCFHDYEELFAIRQHLTFAFSQYQELSHGRPPLPIGIDVTSS